MPSKFSLAHDLSPVSLLPAAGNASARTSSYRSVRNLAKLFIICRVNQADATGITITPMQAQDLAGTGAKQVGAMPIWPVENTATSDLLVQQTAAQSFTTDSATGEKIIVFELLPESVLDTTDGFLTVAVSASASASSDIVDAMMLGETFFPGSVPTTYSL